MKKKYAYNTKGFTLIELLVVVLIISILAAIALPQYQLAIYKSRAAQLFLAVRTIKLAEQAYFLQRGTYTANLDDLEIKIPASVSFSIAPKAGEGVPHPRVVAKISGSPVRIYGAFDEEIWQCYPKGDSQTELNWAKKICQSLGCSADSAQKLNRVTASCRIQR